MKAGSVTTSVLLALGNYAERPYSFHDNEVQVEQTDDNTIEIILSDGGRFKIEVTEVGQTDQS